MEPPTAFADLKNASFDDFVRFLFDRQVDPRPKPPKAWDPWHWHVSVEFDADIICDCYVRLFQEPRFLLTRFTKDQLDEGFWAIQGHLDCSAYRLIYDSNLSLAGRLQLLRSMYGLFERLFVDQPLDTAVQMWWDSFCYDWHSGIRNRERDSEDQQLQDVYFETLARVLAIDSEICQDAALHGLGHLHHPKTQALVERFLAEHPQISEPRKQYAMAAARFQVP